MIIKHTATMAIELSEKDKEALTKVINILDAIDEEMGIALGEENLIKAKNGYGYKEFTSDEITDACDILRVLVEHYCPTGELYLEL